MHKFIKIRLQHVLSMKTPKTRKWQITQKLAGNAALFNPLTGDYVLNNCQSGDKLDSPQNWIGNKMCGVRDSWVHHAAPQPNHLLPHTRVSM